MESGAFSGYLAVGLSSKVGKGRKHVVMLDIDELHRFEHILDIVKLLIEEYRFSNGYIFKSSGLIDGKSVSKNHWHIIFLDKLHFADIINAIEPYVDKSWLQMSIKRKEFILRCSPRIYYGDKGIEKRDIIDFVTVVASPYKDYYPKSNAHRVALNRIYDIKIPARGRFDCLTKTRMAIYAEKPKAKNHQSNKLTMEKLK